MPRSVPKAVSRPDSYTTGRPPTFSADHCKRAIELGRQGKTLTQIAVALDVTRETIYHWMQHRPEFSYAMQRALEHAQAFWEDMGQTGVHNRDFSPNAYRFQMINRFRSHWRDTSHTESTDTHINIQADVSQLAALLATVLEQEGDTPHTTERAPNLQTTERAPDLALSDGVKTIDAVAESPELPALPPALRPRRDSD